eukprot:scaffold1026_cov141-Skeletonema_menzelii.AAC.6
MKVIRVESYLGGITDYAILARQSPPSTALAMQCKAPCSHVRLKHIIFSALIQSVKTHREVILHRPREEA